MAKAKTKAATTSTAASAPAPKKSGFPVILIIVGILCILCAGATVLGVFLINRAKRNAGDSFQDAFKNLLEKGVEDAIEDRVEDENGGDSDISFDGDLPNDFPSDVPVYPNTSIGLSSSTDDGDGKSIWVNFTATDSAQDVNDYYVEELENEGWTITSKTQFLGYSIIAEKNGREVTVYASDYEDGTTAITVTVKE